MDDRGQVGTTARALGFAGLLPQVAAVGLVLLGRRDPTDLSWIPLMMGYGLAMVYGAVILSFLGGMWWTMAMRRRDRQGALAIVAVLPSLIGVATIGVAGAAGPGATGWPAVALGSAIMLTLFGDRHLVHTGEAPAGWMRLRVPLSLGLGTLTIAVGVLLASPPLR